jgi:O-succinylbenzoic acid--CoA ligase
VRELVALDLPSSPRLFQLVVDEWERDNAVMILDQRLSPELKRQHVALAGATMLIGPDESAEHLPGAPVEEGDALVVMTSGSTGEPRAAVHTHDSIAASARASSTRLDLTTASHWLLCLPPSHVGGFSVFSRCHYLGMPLTVHESFQVERVMDAARDGATHVSLVLTALRRIDSLVFRMVLLGGSSMPSDLPTNVVTTYGLTETMGGVVYNGRPLDGVEIRIVEDEILIKSPSLMRCYRHGENLAEWLLTGDLGHLDAEGRLVVHGRRGDLIVTGGEKVWPKTVEDVLLNHPRVQDCAVRGLPDTEWGSRVVAWVVTGADAATADQLRGHVRDQLSAIHAPKEIRFVDRIPRTALGKVDQPGLLAAAWR